MEYVNIDLLVLFLKWGAYAIGGGMVVIMPLEFLLFGIIKLFHFFKFWR